MVTTGADGARLNHAAGLQAVTDNLWEYELPVVRRYEAAGFRAWPAASTHYDGAWLVRLSADHPAKRLNSINPLDPADVADFGPRIERAAAYFVEEQRPLTFRITPLAGHVLDRYLEEGGWRRLDDSTVMRLSLDEAGLDEAMDQIPMRDVGRFVSAAITVQAADPTLGAGLAAVIEAIEPEAGLFVVESGGEPLAAAICVQDGDLAGLFEVATAAGARGKGHSRRLVTSALKWARMRGAKEAWLQVEAANEPAVRLYRSLGFTEAYRYHYRRQATG